MQPAKKPVLKCEGGVKFFAVARTHRRVEARLELDFQLCRPSSSPWGNRGRAPSGHWLGAGRAGDSARRARYPATGPWVAVAHGRPRAERSHPHQEGALAVPGSGRAPKCNARLRHRNGGGGVTDGSAPGGGGVLGGDTGNQEGRGGQNRQASEGTHEVSYPFWGRSFKICCSGTMA